MATGKKSYPRATLRKIVKAHSRKNVSKGVDSLVFLNYVLFIEELMQNATRKARNDGEKSIAAKDIRKVTMVYYFAAIQGLKLHSEEPGHFDSSSVFLWLAHHHRGQHSEGYGQGDNEMPPTLTIFESSKEIAQCIILHTLDGTDSKLWLRHALCEKAIHVPRQIFDIQRSQGAKMLKTSST
ncbi:uncharacterized protein PV06_08864 [Exophiala oligosperma]|uniref:Transcription factor CBF/NF-Y/archaeal histone domain-containing protein n=2 Tax=Chaetothyriales TaxID=34395 RepID=A0A0D2D9F8_9EURO|nr:uncharacterized protein PV06_08864 [Exophiala oligosperma]KAJ9635724.1 hypothetical protein H2204_005684 [Knufia peltigerae]KIW39050.1 hypothetical protein PV06_08864 [Exophiala oligosperma]